jgi:hypothetical protein
MTIRWTIVAAVSALLFPAAGRPQVEQHVEYVSDIDRWRVEVFAGAVHPHTLLQGPIREVGFNEPVHMCFAADGQAFLATEGVILTLSNGVVRYFAGTPGLPGYRDGLAGQSLLGRELSICPDGRGGLYIGDRSNRCVRRLANRGGDWFVETVAGDPSKPPSAGQLERVRDEGPLGPARTYDVIDGTGTAARFSYLHSNVIADAEGNAYQMDSDFLRRITPSGKVETLNPRGGSGDPAKPVSEPLESAHFRLIMGGGMCFGGDGAIYVADRWNHCIRRVDLRRQEVTVAVGQGQGYVDGPERECGFYDSPGYIVWDPYRKRFYTNGVDDCGLRTWENGRMMTIAGGDQSNKDLSGPARLAGTKWCGILAVDPRPPHDLYFWSDHPDWRGRVGRLFTVAAVASGGVR